MNTERKTRSSNHRIYSIKVSLNKEEYEETLRLQALWECTLPRVYRRLLFNNKSVVLNTRIAMESLDRLGLALQESNNILNRPLRHPVLTQSSAGPDLQELQRITRAVEANGSRIKECTTAILQLIKKI